MIFIYAALYLAMTFLTTLMARLKNLSPDKGYMGIFFCALLLTPVTVFFVVLILPARPRERPPRAGVPKQA